MLRFIHRQIGDFFKIAGWLAMWVLALAINLTLVTLQILINAINLYVQVVVTLTAAYIAKINAVTEPGAPKGTSIH